MARKPKRGDIQPLTRERVLEALAETPGGNKRDLARRLKLKGSDRIALKRILKELAADGIIEGTKTSGFKRPGEIPEVATLEITGQDTDGETRARPSNWDSNEEPPAIYVMPPKQGEPVPGAGERVLARLTPVGDGFEARVIRIIGAAPRRQLGVVRLGPKGARLVPIDKKVRAEFAIDTRDLDGAKDNELVLAEPLPGRAAGFARAKIVARVGDMNSPRTVSLIAIHTHGIPTEFPQEALDEAEAAKNVDPRGREDLRTIPLLTIDPEDARDHDDAVWAEPDSDPKNKGGHAVIVAIADVAAYVTPGSALDREAFKRGNSAYFPDRVVPMLPERLSADLCSLKEGVDRACFAVRMVFDAKGNKRSHKFIRGIMRSAARLTYQGAQRAFDGKPDAGMSEIVQKTLRDLWAAYQALVLARKERDPVDLDLPERRIILGADGKVSSIAFRERLESMRLIEEFMIAANVAAAESGESARVPVVYRIHEPPSKEKLFAFGDYLKTIGMNFAKGQVLKPGVFNKILAQGKDGPHERALNDVVLRTQSQAVYAPNNAGHFGLNLQRYAHFTSPIRRYADLLVHRGLIKGLKFGDDGLTSREEGKLGEISIHISQCERRAMAAERDSNDRYVAAFLADRVGALFEARVTGVTRFGLFVRLIETGAEGLLPVRELGFEYFRHDERRHALVGDRSNTIYRMGDPLTVRLEEAAPLTGGLRFALAEAKGGETRKSHPRPGSPKGSTARFGKKSKQVRGRK